MNLSLVFKTGLASGVIHGILQGVISLLTFVIYREQIIETIRNSIPSNVNIPFTVEQLADMGMMFAIPGSIIGGMIAGVIVCFIFSFMYHELLGKNSKVKGIFLCALLLVGVIFGEFVYPGVVGGIFLLNTRYLLLLPASFAFFLVFGYVMGMFYDKFGKEGRR